MSLGNKAAYWDRSTGPVGAGDGAAGGGDMVGVSLLLEVGANQALDLLDILQEFPSDQRR